MSFVCAICGKGHAGVSLDTAFTFPDEVWEIPEQERAEHASWTSDLCQFDGRYFIRGFLPIPLIERQEHYGWGVWVEVDRPTFERYLELFDVDARKEPPVRGLLANEVPTYPESIGLPVQVQFGSRAQRPHISFPEEACHRFAEEQRNGMREARLHEILVARGEIEEP